jgi:signal transduction histidine kinase
MESRNFYYFFAEVFENMPDPVFFYFCLFIFILIGVLLFVIMNKDENVKSLLSALQKMKKSFEELDAQAKLIVKTDLELNKTQEELDKRLHSLDALQKTSNMISTTLNENEIFQKLDDYLLKKLGFEKSLILTYKPPSVQCKVAMGYTEESLHYIIPNLQKDTSLLSALEKGEIFSSTNSPKQRKETINRIFNTEHFVLAPILTQDGFIGAVFVGNQSNVLSISEGDEELVSILANQMGQSIENARLYEQAFCAKQDLEIIVQNRTKQAVEASEEAKRISKKKSEFISAVSHELRTPLTSIKGYASILSSGKLGDIPLAAIERIKKINMHSDNLVKLINDLLDISRIESGRVEMNLGKCDLQELVENVIDILTPQMKEKNIHCVPDIAANVPEMMLDATQMERVFINTIGNAIKFTPNGGSITPKIYVDQEKDIVKIEISDTGIGISEQDIEKLYDEFYRVENNTNQNVKGSGLGLALVKQIIEAYKGKTWITSKLNEGTTVHLTLPLPKKRIES